MPAKRRRPAGLQGRRDGVLRPVRRGLRGPDLDRPAEKVLEDVLDDFCTVEHARQAYWVVLDFDTETVDIAAIHGRAAIACKKTSRSLLLPGEKSSGPVGRMPSAATRAPAGSAPEYIARTAPREGRHEAPCPARVPGSEPRPCLAAGRHLRPIGGVAVQAQIAATGRRRGVEPWRNVLGASLRTTWNASTASRDGAVMLRVERAFAQCQYYVLTVVGKRLWWFA